MNRAAIDHAAAGLQGFRWPAEWEPHAATWLSWPHNRETWPTAFDAAETAFVEIAAALAPGERVRIGAPETLAEQARGRLAAAGVPLSQVDFAPYATGDAWVRDHGPVMLRHPDTRRVALDFEFDNWGRKYPGWETDNAVPRELAAFLELPRHPVPFVLEGGAIDGDGQGTVLTTESCLLHPNRAGGAGAGDTGRSLKTCETVLRALLRCEQVVWLAGGIEGDDTDGHVDDVARFIGPGRVAAVRCRDRAEPDHDVLEENWRRLGEARDATGARLQRVELPAASRVVAASGDARLPASHANFYLANEVALVPVFGGESDDRALRILEEALPGRRIEPIRCEGLVEGLGAIHCCTKEEPVGPPSTENGL